MTNYQKFVKRVIQIFTDRYLMAGDPFFKRFVDKLKKL